MKTEYVSMVVKAKSLFILLNIGTKHDTLRNGKEMKLLITTTKDSNLRLAAQRRGFLLMKRRDQKYAPGLGDGYMILDSYSGNIVAGHRYDMTAEAVRDFLNEH